MVRAERHHLDNPTRNRSAPRILRRIQNFSFLLAVRHNHSRNEKLFHELYKAHLESRATFDPSQGDTWYEGELGFFDFHIVPLAKELKECGVFGVASGEYLNYAMANRAEFASKGEETVRRYMERYNESQED